jgi:chromosome partitioning protein
MSETIVIANQKGGVGKTTTAINLAYALASLNQETLLIDLDPQRNATSGIGVELSENDKTVYDALCGTVSVESAIKPTSLDWLNVLPANHELAGVEIELASMEDREFFLKNTLSSIKDIYKYIIIDCPPSLGLITVNALTASDSIITPIQCEYYAMEGLAYFTETVSKVQNSLNPSLTFDGYVLTMHDSRINLSNQVQAEVSKYYGDKIYKTVIPRNIRLAEAPSFGKPIFNYDPYCKGSSSYFELAVEFLIRRGANPKHYSKLVPGLIKILEKAATAKEAVAA